MTRNRIVLLLVFATAVLFAPEADASTLGDPFSVSTLTLGPADDPAADPTPTDRDTDVVYDGVDLFLTNVALQGDVTGLTTVLEGCDPNLLDTGTEGFVFADVDTDSFISAADVIQDDEGHGLNVNSAGNAPVFGLVSGMPVWIENADWALSLYRERGPACTGYDTATDAFGTPPTMPALSRAWGSMANLSAAGDLVEADLLFGASLTAAYEGNPGLGAIPAGIVGYHLAFDVSTLAGSLTPLSGSCGNDLQCDDGLVCNGLETCNLTTRTCEPGTPLDCSGLTDQCGVGVCTEGVGCTVDPEDDGTWCSDGNFCTTGDICIGGVCTGTDGADTDGDGYCDNHEIIAGCDELDGAIIPPQPAAYSGGRIANRGEVLLTWAVPDNRDVVVPLDPACAQSGLCGPTGFCTEGKMGDPCTLDTDCDQPPWTCRLIVNHQMTPDMSLRSAWFNRRPRTLVDAAFLPLAPGCARKLDFAIPHLPDGQVRKTALVIKAEGTMEGRTRRDTDRICFFRECPRRLSPCDPPP